MELNLLYIFRNGLLLTEVIVVVIAAIEVTFIVDIVVIAAIEVTVIVVIAAIVVEFVDFYRSGQWNKT